MAELSKVLVLSPTFCNPVLGAVEVLSAPQQFLVSSKAMSGPKSSSSATHNYSFDKQALENVLKPAGRRPVKVLAVVGQPGIGKSTMLNKMVSRWLLRASPMPASFSEHAPSTALLGPYLST
jgi:ribosome biogenesis GTPase A